MGSAVIYLSSPTETNRKEFTENLNTNIGDFKKNKDIPSNAVIYHGQIPLKDSNIIKDHLDDEEDKVAYYHIKRVSTKNPLLDEEKTGYTKNPLLGSGMKIKLNKKYRKKRNNTKKRKSHKRKSHKRKSHKRKRTRRRR
jgi:hypothetical protein